VIGEVWLGGSFPSNRESISLGKLILVNDLLVLLQTSKSLRPSYFLHVTVFSAHQDSLCRISQLMFCADFTAAFDVLECVVLG
jgi:hypothetical protein